MNQFPDSKSKEYDLEERAVKFAENVKNPMNSILSFRESPLHQTKNFK